MKKLNLAPKPLKKNMKSLKELKNYKNYMKSYLTIGIILKPDIIRHNLIKSG